MNGWPARNSGKVLLMTSGMANENPMNEPNVPMYKKDMIQVCRSRREMR